MKRITMIANNDLPNMRIIKGDKLVVVETSYNGTPGAYIVLLESEQIVTDNLEVIRNGVLIGKVEKVIVEI